MINDINLGDVWKKARKAKGFTQEYVSEQLDLGPRYISDLERNKTLGSLPTLVNLCNLYEVTPTFILQDYLNLPHELKVDSNLIGFYSLSDENKSIIIKLIQYMNENNINQ